MFPYRYAASFVSDASYGPVTACRLSRRTGYPQWSEWLSKEGSSGGAILDLLSHDIDQALQMFGVPESVSAVSHGEIDTMVGTLHYAGGLDVKIEGGWFAPEIPFSAGFQVTAKDAALSFEEGKLTLQLPGGDQVVEVPATDDYLDEVRYFVECCRGNVFPERCSPSESAEAVRVANLLKVSREQDGKEVLCEL